jgi:hypothetical protein
MEVVVSVEIDPSTMPSLTEDQWAAYTQAMISDPPRRFAIMQEWGERVDGRLAAWGVAYDHGIEVIDAESSTRFQLETPNLALLAYTRLPHVKASVVWIDPEPE